MDLALRAEFGSRLVPGGVLLWGPLGRPFLFGLLVADGLLDGRRLGIDGNPLLLAFCTRLCCLVTCLCCLAVGEGFGGAGFFALLCLRLLDLTLGS